MLQNAAYGKRRSVREAVEKGEREAPQLKAWQKVVMVDGVRFIAHVTKGTFYLGFPVMSFGKSSWTLDGKPTTKEALREFFQPSAFTPAPTKADFNALGQDLYRSPKIENIESMI